MPRAKRSSSSFNPRLLLALEEGCKREVQLACNDHKEAVRCRQEINKLRAALREEGRTGWENYTTAGVYIDSKNPTVVVIKPKATEYKAALDAAGIPDPDPVPAPKADDPPMVFDSILGDLRKYEP